MKENDELLVKKVKLRDENAFRELYDRHFGKVRGILWNILRDEDAVEEATQEVWLTVWTKLKGFRGKSKFTTWLYSVSLRVALQRKREERAEIRRKQGYRPETWHDPDVVGELDAKEMVLFLHNSIRRKDWRGVLLHRAFAVTNKEGAALMNVTIPAYKAMSHKMQKRCKRCLQNAA